MAAPLPRIGITMGEPAGVGPEIIIKALHDVAVTAACSPVVFGDRGVFEREADRLGLPGPADMIEVSRLHLPDIRYGKPTAAGGKAMAACIIEAVAQARAGAVDAVVTAPISKKVLQEAGYNYPGHTEMLAELTGTKDVVMMLAGETLRVVLVTIHCAYADVPKLLSTQQILKTIAITHESLKPLLAGASPRLAVAGLNPHAGEEGLFGDEERRIIAPAVAEARSRGIDAAGPAPPDTLFYHAARGRYDAVVCMYHDQGLIPLKLLHFDTGVNVTLGLPIVRTSVDHGTAYDIAGQGIANPSSLVSAITMAVQMSRGRPGA